MADSTDRQQATSRFIAEDLLQHQQEAQQRDQESKRREDAAKKTFESINNGQSHDSKDLKTTTDKAYQYLLGEKLTASNGKPLDKETDVKIAKQLLKTTEGKESGKIRDAIRDHSSLAVRLPEDKRHEYANIATTKAQMQYLKDVPREEKTRVQTPHSPQSPHKDLSEQDLHAIHRMKDRER